MCAPAVFIVGCFCLPLFWLTNFWLFWPYLRGRRHNAVIEKCAHCIPLRVCQSHGITDSVNDKIAFICAACAAPQSSRSKALSKDNVHIWSTFTKPGVSVNLCTMFADARWSAIGFFVVVPPFIAWLLTFSVGYDEVFSQGFLKRVDTSRLNLREIGWLF